MRLLISHLMAAGLAVLLAAPGQAAPYQAADASQREEPNVLALLRAENFARLEDELARLARTASENDLPLAAAYDAFAAADPALATSFAHWQAARPQSVHPRLARARYHVHIASLTPSRHGWSLARADLVAALDLDPASAPAHEQLARLALVEGRPAEAERWIAEGRAAAPTSVALYRARLDLLHPWRQPDREPAELLAALDETLQEVAAAAPKQPALLSLRGYGAFVTAELLRRQRRHEQADTYYQRALEAGPDAAYHRQRGVNAYEQGRPRAAHESFADALELSPRDPVLLDWRARSLAAMDAPSAALADWQAALDLDPLNPRILINQARFLHAIGRQAAAADSFERALYYGADDPRVRRARGRYFLAQRGQPKAALEDLSRATELAPHDGEAWFMYARALFEARHCEAAAEVLASYETLCRNGLSCNSGQMAWADRARAGTRDPDICPVHGILGP